MSIDFSQFERDLASTLESRGYTKDAYEDAKRAAEILAGKNLTVETTNEG